MIAFPLRMLALSMFTLAGAAHAADACRYTPFATLQLRASGDTRQPTVDGSINGKPAVMLVDTGLGPSMLVKDAAEKFGLALDSTGKYVSGVGGASVMYQARVEDFSVAGAHSGRAAMPVLGTLGDKPGYDAIAGAEFLLQADLEIALAKNQVRFFRAKDCADTYLAYWNKEAMEIPFGGTDAGHRNPRFTVQVNGVALDAEISTGTTNTSLTRRAAEQAGIRIDGPNVVKAGTSSGVGAAHLDTWVADVDTFTLGSETIKHGHILVRENAPQGSNGAPGVVLGTDFLRAHRVLIAMSQNRLYVTYEGGEVFPPLPARSN